MLTLALFLIQALMALLQHCVENVIRFTVSSKLATVHTHRNMMPTSAM